MFHFELESDREVTVAGIGLLPVGQPVEISEFTARMFQAHQGYSLAQAKFPPYVTLTAVLTGGGE